jgi:hypothetical protein
VEAEFALRQGVNDYTRPKFYFSDKVLGNSDFKLLSLIKLLLLFIIIMALQPFVGP